MVNGKPIELWDDDDGLIVHAAIYRPGRIPLAGFVVLCRSYGPVHTNSIAARRIGTVNCFACAIERYE